LFRLESNTVGLQNLINWRESREGNIHHKMSGIRREQPTNTWGTWQKKIHRTHSSFFYGFGCNKKKHC